MKELGIPDPTTVRENAVDNVRKWSHIQPGVGYHKG